LPPQCGEKRKGIIEKAKQILNRWNAKQFTGIIVMGDMNTTTKDHMDRTGKEEAKEKKKWIQIMEGAELIDSYRYLNKERQEFTWEGKSKSRIDMIWIKKDLKELCREIEIQDIRDEIKTDHKMVALKIDLGFITKDITKIRASAIRTIIDYKNTSEQQWNKWNER
jgi:exonuclease III